MKPEVGYERATGEKAWAPAHMNQYASTVRSDEYVRWLESEWITHRLKILHLKQGVQFAKNEADGGRRLGE